MLLKERANDNFVVVKYRFKARDSLSRDEKFDSTSQSARLKKASVVDDMTSHHKVRFDLRSSAERVR